MGLDFFLFSLLFLSFYFSWSVVYSSFVVL